MRRLLTLPLDADADQIGVLEDHREQPVLPPSRHEVLVDDHTREETQPGPQLDVVRGDHVEVPLAGDHQRAHARRPGRGAAERCATRERTLDRGEQRAAGEGVDDARLVAAEEVDSARPLGRRYVVRARGVGAAPHLEHRHIAAPPLLPELRLPLGTGGGVLGGGGDEHDRRGGATGEADELPHDLRRALAAADEQEVAARRYCGQRCRHRQHEPESQHALEQRRPLSVAA